MLALLIAVAVFTGLALLVLRWAADDLADGGALSAKAVVASWLLYVFHADTVTSAAWISALAVGVPRGAALAVGGVVAVAGFTFFLSATLALVRHGDLAGPRTRRLVTAGPYRLSRHPQNLGWGVMLLGIAVAGRSLVALALVGMFVFFVERYARLEERQMQQDFGVPYDEYRESTSAVLTLRGSVMTRDAARARTP